MSLPNTNPADSGIGMSRVHPRPGSDDVEAQAQGEAVPQDSTLWPTQPPPPGSSGSNSGKLDADNKAVGLQDMQLVVQGGGDPPATNGENSVKKADGEEEEFEVAAVVTYADIAKQFSILGWIAFGGPAAHIGLFEKRLVAKLRWMTHAVYMELFALGSCLPGPSSTQVSFAMGTVRKGVLGGLLSGALFQYPGAIIMTGVGVGAAEALGNPSPPLLALTAGVSAVGVALVASAAKGLLIKLCNTQELAIIGTLAAAAAIYWNPPWLFPLVIVVAGLITIVTNRNKDLSLKGDVKEGVLHYGVTMPVGAIMVAVWLGVLIAVLVLVRTLDYDHRIDATPLDWFEVFYRTGSIIYGGGQVVLPMLFNDLVVQDCVEGRVPPCQEDRARSWVTAQQFYGGLGIVQAMPGPLFNFSAYLGAIIAYNAGVPFIVGTVVCWFGLFSPGVILMFAVLPYWKKFRAFQLYRRALPGMNASSVGLILASVFKMTVDVYAISPFPTSSLCIGLFAFTAVDSLKIFEPIVVIGGIVLGIIAWAGKMR